MAYSWSRHIRLGVNPVDLGLTATDLRGLSDYTDIPVALLRTITDSRGLTDAAAESGTTVTMPGSDLHENVDFAEANSSGFWRPNGVTGLGVAVTTYRVRANSSTHTAAANALVAGQTNQYRIMKGGSQNAGAPVAGLVFADFTIQGLPQGMNFGGLDLLYATNPHVHDVTIKGIQGSASAPPGETFTLHTQRTDRPIITDVTLDGRNASGTPIAATLSGNSYLPNGATFTRVQHLYANTGFGTAIFQAAGPNPYTWNQCVYTACRKAINIEHALCNGPFVFNGCTFSPTLGTGMGEIMQVSSQTSSAHVEIHDPILAGGLTFPIKVRNYPGAGTQNPADIKLFIGGVDKTSDPTKFELVNY